MTLNHDVLFKAPMIRAILTDAKTQTRRVITDRNSLGNVKPSQCDMARAFVDSGPSPAGNAGPYLHAPVVRDRYGRADDEDGVNIAAVGIVERIYSRWNVGDRLHVRETWNIGRPALTSGVNAGVGFVPMIRGPMNVDQYREAHPDHKLIYAATDDFGGAAFTPPYRPSIHMPRWACRIVLEITELRIERLQDISEDDARAEGVPTEIPVRIPHPLKRRRSLGWGTSPSTHREAFAFIWDLINGERDDGVHAWAHNGWVRAFTFRVVESPTLTKAVA